MRLVENDIRKILTDFKTKHILIIGEVMLDQYISCSFGSRPDVDSYTQELLWDKHRIWVGGAGVVARLLKNLEVNTHLFGIIGKNDPDTGEEEWYATKIKKLLEEKGIDSDGVVICDRSPTILKIRINTPEKKSKWLNTKISRQIGCEKICLESPKPICKTRKEMLDKIKEKSRICDAIIITDFLHGLFGLKKGKKLTCQKERFLDEVCKLAKNERKKLILKTREWHDIYRDKFINVMIIDEKIDSQKINYDELSCKIKDWFEKMNWCELIVINIQGKERGLLVCEKNESEGCIDLTRYCFQPPSDFRDSLGCTSILTGVFASLWVSDEAIKSIGKEKQKLLDYAYRVYLHQTTIEGPKATEKEDIFIEWRKDIDIQKNVLRPIPFSKSKISAQEALHTAQKIAETIESLSVDERKELKNILGDIVHETSQARIAETKFNGLIKKAGKDAYDAIKSILIDVVSEAVRKTIFGP
jgi:hypothetical protein